MSEFLKSMQIAASGMTAQTSRLRTSAENVANVDTPGYRRKLLPFEQVYDTNTDTMRVAAGKLYLDRSQLTQINDPGHPMADEQGFYDGSNVNLVIEMADAREAQRSFEANLRIFDQSRRMATSLIELLRR